MAVIELLDSVRVLISNHNVNFEPVDSHEHQPGWIKIDKFFQNLKIFGSHTEDDLKSMSYEDILCCMEVIGSMKPMGLAKAIAKVFRGKDERPGLTTSYISERTVQRLTLRELIERYDINSSAVRTRTCLIAKRLDEISKGQRFLVFPDDTGKPDIDFSVSLLEELCAGQTSMSEVAYNGDVRHVFKIYEAMASYVAENPLYPGRPLRVGETCDQTLRSWAGVPKNVRQLIYMAVKSGDLLVSIDRSHAIMDLAISGGDTALSTLRQRYPRVSIKFDAAEKIGDLPKLLLELSQSTGNPFATGKKVDGPLMYPQQRQ